MAVAVAGADMGRDGLSTWRAMIRVIDPVKVKKEVKFSPAALGGGARR